MKNATLPYYNDADRPSTPTARVHPRGGPRPEGRRHQGLHSTQINNMEQRGTSPDDAWDAAVRTIDKAIG
ncbi:extracellular solute-binding protein [Streptomyces californicus]